MILSKFLTIMVGAHLIGAIMGDSTGPGMTPREALSFAFFPIGVVIGLGIAIRWSGIGGLITIVGMIGFLIVRPDLILDSMIYVYGGGPGILFLIYWLLTRKSKKE